MNDGVNSDTTDYKVNPVAKIVQSRFTNLMIGDKKHLPHFGCTAVAIYADLLYICMCVCIHINHARHTDPIKTDPDAIIGARRTSHTLITNSNSNTNSIPFL